MDNITVNTVDCQPTTYSHGSLFICDETEEIYILVQFRYKKGFYAISLKNGYSRCDHIQTTAEECVDGLRYLGSGLRIVVSDPKLTWMEESQHDITKVSQSVGKGQEADEYLLTCLPAKGQQARDFEYVRVGKVCYGSHVRTMDQPSVPMGLGGTK